MANSTVFTALHVNANGQSRIRTIMRTEEVASVNREIAVAFNHPAFFMASQTDEAIELPVEMLCDTEIDRSIGSINSFAVSKQTIRHIDDALKELHKLLKVSTGIRVFVSIE